MPLIVCHSVCVRSKITITKKGLEWRPNFFLNRINSVLRVRETNLLRNPSSKSACPLDCLQKKWSVVHGKKMGLDVHPLLEQKKNWRLRGYRCPIASNITHSAIAAQTFSMRGQTLYCTLHTCSKLYSGKNHRNFV